MQNRLFSCNGMCRCEQIEGIACQYQSRSLANLLFAANFGLVKKLLSRFVYTTGHKGSQKQNPLSWLLFHGTEAMKKVQKSTATVVAKINTNYASLTGAPADEA
jgi:hypothetical protein